tara:strand:+ start:41269 stop:41943 length:675 start_codon:yes stop_codon:yes gene_type:complete
MRIDIITALPDLIIPALNQSIIGRAVKSNVVNILFHNLKDYGLGKNNQIDDYQYGGGAGMVLRVEPIFTIINQLKSERDYDDIIYLTPDGETLKQTTCNTLSSHKNIIMLCGHYKGIDHRVREALITREISIGDYVLTGGELAAAVLTDAIVRLIPGAMSDESSALSDSFQDNLLAPPVYTRPENYEGLAVPKILLSGDDKRINEWREEQAFSRTEQLRPDLLK